MKTINTLLKETKKETNKTTIVKDKDQYLVNR